MELTQEACKEIASQLGNLDHAQLEKLLRPILPDLLANTTDVPYFINSLYSLGAISVNETDVCASKSTNFEKLQTAFRIVVQKRKGAQLVNALSISNNTHIVELIRAELLKQEQNSNALAQRQHVDPFSHVTVPLKKRGLENFIQEFNFVLCNKTLSPSKMAAALRADKDIISTIMAPPDSYTSNLKLYDFIARKATPEEFINALNLTGNSHVIQFIESEVKSVKQD